MLVRSRGLGDVYKRQAIGCSELLRPDVGAAVVDGVTLAGVAHVTQRLSLIHI